MMMMARARHSVQVVMVQSRHAAVAASAWTYERSLALARWTVAPITDERGLSFTRFILMYLTFHVVQLIDATNALPPTVATLAIAIIAASFGEKMFRLFLNRNTTTTTTTSATSTTTDTKVDAAAVVSAIKEKKL